MPKRNGSGRYGAGLPSNGTYRLNTKIKKYGNHGFNQVIAEDVLPHNVFCRAGHPAYHRDTALQPKGRSRPTALQ